MSGERILIVEDERITAMSVQQILESAGYLVAGISSTGEKGVRMAKKDRPDLVLMDFKLEGDMDGVEAARKIRKSCNIPVIFVTAHSDQDALRRIKTVEPFGYIIKPFRDDALVNAIEIALYKSVMERKLRYNQQQLQSILDNATSIIYMKNLSGHYLLANKLLESLLGVSSDEIKGKTDYDLFPKDVADACVGNDQLVLSRNEPIEFEETVPHDGVTHTYISRKFPIFGDDGTPVAVCGISTDITERKQAEKIIRHMSSHDTLTNIPNRALLMDRMDQALARARRDKTKIAVMFIDLDNFKPINDAMGHIVGDKALKLIAKRLSSCLRETDTVARFGGDEFVVILTDINNREDASNMAQKLNASLSKPINLGGKKISMGASIGIAFYPDHAKTPETLLSMADKAMYVVKNKGKKSYHFSTETE